MSAAQTIRQSIGRIDEALGSPVKKTLWGRRYDAVKKPLDGSQEHHFQEWWHEVRPHQLKALCDQYGSDKGSVNRAENSPYPWPAHTYADVYASLFEHCRDSIKLVFECGIGTNDETVTSNMSASGHPGASLRVWRDYFPQAEVFGADIDPKALFAEDRIETFEVDQTDSVAVKSMWDKIDRDGFDLIVDDGLHEYHAGVALFEGSFDRLKPGGLYVIEDVNPDDLTRYVDYFGSTSYWVSYLVLHRPYPVPYIDNGLVLVRAPS